MEGLTKEQQVEHLLSRFFGCDEVIVIGLNYNEAGVVRVGSTMPYVPDIAWTMDIAKNQLFETVGNLDD